MSALHSTSTTSDVQEPAATPGLINRQLDALISEYASRGEPFTVCEWRDRLIKLPELAETCPKTLRYRVRDRIKTLQQQALARQVGFQGKRRPVFVLDPDACPIDAKPSPSSSPDCESAAEGSPHRSSLPFATYLAEECHRLKLDMQAALGETSHYARILSQYPEQRALIEPLHEAACQRGSEAKGALDAVVTLRHKIGEEAGS